MSKIFIYCSRKMILGMSIDINDSNMCIPADISQTVPLPVSIGIQFSL